MEKPQKKSKTNTAALKFAAGAAEAVAGGMSQNSYGRKNMNSKMTPRSSKK